MESVIQGSDVRVNLRGILGTKRLTPLQIQRFSFRGLGFRVPGSFVLFVLLKFKPSQISTAPGSFLIEMEIT